MRGRSLPTTKKDLESGVAGVQEARWTQSQDLDLDDNPIAVDTRICYPLHADPDGPVIMQRQVGAVQVVPKTVELPQTLLIDSVEDIPVVQVPRVQVVEKTVEIPQLQTAKKIAETPQTQTIQGTQAPESLGITPVCQVAQTGHVEELVEVSKVFS